MVPLGQDRFYRQYWLVMSIPCILIEDCSCTDKNPYYTHATIRNRQIVYTYPELAKRMGLSSPEDACKRFREAICFIKDNESVDREELTFRIAATIPHQSSSSGSLPLEQLRALVKPERVGIHDSTSHNTCPVVSQLAKLRCSAAKQSAPSTVWNRTANSTLNSGPSSSTLDCSSTIAVKSEECANDNVITSNESKCKKHISNDDDNESLSTKNDETDLIERAKWTVDCLEASLNPRGVRESRLRKTIGQLRPLLIKVVAMCPLELICSLNNNNPSGLDDKIAVVPQNTPVSTESATITDEMCRSEKSPESIMCSWLETALVGIGYRLGRLNLIKDLLFDRDYKPKEIPSEDQAELKQAPTEIPPNKNSDEADNDVVSSSTENANIADNSSKRFQTSEPVLNSSGLNMNVRRLAKILLSLGHDVSPKAVAGPMANNERTLRGGPVGTPSGKQSADLENILSETPPSSEINDSTSNSNMVQPLRTTGWQRWCISVEQASSTSQLHLLARALERGALRAALGGRGVSSAISNYVSQHPLPTLKCTLCRGPPDVHYLSTAYGNLSAFSVCSGNRRTSIRKPSRPRHSDISASNSPVSNNIDTPLTGFISNHSSLSSITSARLEVTGGSVVLCAFCLRSAGVLSSVTDNDTRLPHPNNQAYELSTTLVYSNEDYVCPNENVLRQRSVLENLNDCDEVHNSITEATCFSPKSLDVSSIDKLCVTVDVHYDDEVEQLLRPYNQRKKPKEHSKSLSTEVEGNCRLKRASIILDNCAPQITNTRDRGRRSYRGRPRKPDIPISSPSSDIPDPIPPLSSNQSQFDQATAERFLTELCMSSSARPLLRCGLGRTVALGELNQSNGDLETDFMPITTIERSRTSHRTRSTTSSSHNAEDRRLYAYDLVGLKELLSRGELPRGPGQVISQLRLLLSHWLRSNRPGSRLHQCASDLLEQMNKKLKLLQSNTVPINGIINSNIGSNDDNLGIVEQHIQTLDTTGHYGKRRRQ
ncbi:unnamed protein product [Heterobilharzia americana]|nr:unnamed protein product [Heterobilharzia americana]